MTQKLRKSNTIDMGEDLTTEVTTKEVEEIDLESPEKLPAAIAAVSRKNPIARSQQFKEAVKSRMAKRNPHEFNEGSDPEYDPEDVEEESSEGSPDEDEDEDEYDEEDEEIVEDDAGEDEDEAEEFKIIKIEKKLKVGRKPTFVKKHAVESKPTSSKSIAQKRGTKAIPAPVQKRFGVEKAKQKVAVSKTPAKKRALETAGPSKSSASKRQAKQEANPDSDSDASCAQSSVSSRKKLKKNENEFCLDLAPREHNSPNRTIRSGNVHIGDSVHVKWHQYRGRNYIIIRPMVDGTMDNRRGINIEMKYLPNLKRAIDSAFECYKEGQ